MYDFDFITMCASPIYKISFTFSASVLSGTIIFPTCLKPLHFPIQFLLSTFYSLMENKISDMPIDLDG